MPEPIDLTNIQHTAQALAEIADKDPNGATVKFDNSDFPTPDACKKAALRLRNNFHAMKQKNRRSLMRAGASQFEANKYAFGNLSPIIEQTDTGWQIRIAKGESILGKFTVVSNTTGEVLS
jgi:hypothetical protein